MFGQSKTPTISTDEQKINSLLTRGVEDVFVRDSLQKKLQSGKQLRVKLGFDPTGGKIHIGRAIVLRKLRAFQELGHKVVFIAGDFTARIGDPSDKLEKRPMLTEQDIVKNLATYKEQVGKIIDLSQAEFHFNSAWLSKLTFSEIAELAESFSVQQMSNRRNFKERLEKGQDVSLREFLYPLMQGYDSVQVEADVEIGGFDQLFNLKAGRTVQKHYGKPEQDVLTISMLEGTDGRKMSTSWGNFITILDEPADMYGKVMSIKDELLPQYFTLATDVPNEEIAHILNERTHPKEAKMRLAREIVTMFHDKQAAEKAEQSFVNTFSKGDVSESAEEIIASRGSKLVDVVLENKLVSSKSEYKRLLDAGGIKILTDEETPVAELGYELTESSTLVKIGKKRFARIVTK